MSEQSRIPVLDPIEQRHSSIELGVGVLALEGAAETFAREERKRRYLYNTGKVQLYRGAMHYGDFGNPNAPGYVAIGTGRDGTEERDEMLYDELAMDIAESNPDVRVRVHRLAPGATVLQGEEVTDGVRRVLDQNAETIVGTIASEVEKQTKDHPRGYLGAIFVSALGKDGTVGVSKGVRAAESMLQRRPVVAAIVPNTHLGGESLQDAYVAAAAALGGWYVVAARYDTIFEFNKETEPLIRAVAATSEPGSVIYTVDRRRNWPHPKLKAHQMTVVSALRYSEQTRRHIGLR